MKKTLFIILASVFFLPGCTKVEKTRTKGIDTIDNTVYFSTTYFSYGFSFSQAKLVSTEDNPYPDIVLYVNTDTPITRLTLQAKNLKPSFYKVGDFDDESSAKAAFDDLNAVAATQWLDMADPIGDNQVWIYRSGNSCYAKIRIVSTINEIRETIPYGECTFEWVYQPDGSLTFPGK